jgi:hypothetical protein
MAERAASRRKNTAEVTGNPVYRTAKETRAYLASQNLRFSLRKVYELIACGDLPHVQIGGRLYVPDLEDWLSKRAADDTAAARAASQRNERRSRVGGGSHSEKVDDRLGRSSGPSPDRRTAAWATAMMILREVASSNDSCESTT